jgi:hypothetical protein
METFPACAGDAEWRQGRAAATETRHRARRHGQRQEHAHQLPGRSSPGVVCALACSFFPLVVSLLCSPELNPKPQNPYSEP